MILGHRPCGASGNLKKSGIQIGKRNSSRALTKHPSERSVKFSRTLNLQILGVAQLVYDSASRRLVEESASLATRRPSVYDSSESETRRVRSRSAPQNGLKFTPLIYSNRRQNGSYFLIKVVRMVRPFLFSALGLMLNIRLASLLRQPAINKPAGTSATRNDFQRPSTK